MIRLILFDIDGTLIFTGGAGEKAFARVLDTQFGIQNGTARVAFAGRTDPGIVREIFLNHGLEPTPENFAKFFDAYVFFLDHFLHQLRGGTHPGVWEWIQALQRLSPPPVLGLLTGNISLGAEIKLRRFDLWDVFATGGFGDDHVERNRIAVVARKRGEQLLGAKLHDEEILVVGDTPLDITCGRHIGAKVLAVATGGAKLSQLQAHQPDWAVSDLRAVSVREACG
ncbi:MAG: HAD hydrolase-like protein [Verrucomicrobia bacterium]|nr:HAD hydrolase-like protein [Verrucomicrobiota bacterium]